MKRVHRQNETQTLLKQKYHLKLLDDYTEDKFFAYKEKYKNVFNQYKSKTKELEELESADQALLQRLDLMKFQYEELEEASLK